MEMALVSVTVSVVVPVTPLPSLAVAVMIVVPVARPAVAKPAAFMVALVGSLLLHSTSLLAASSGSTTALNCRVSPTITPGEGGVIVIDVAFLGVTVSSRAPVTPLPSLAVAVMVTAPVAKPLTKPEEGSTVALAGSLLLHSTSLLAASSGSTAAVNCWVLPTATPTGEGVMAIEVTFLSVTVTVAVPFTLLPSLAVAVMVTAPAVTPVTKPAASTAATAGSLLLHDTS